MIFIHFEIHFNYIQFDHLHIDRIVKEDILLTLINFTIVCEMKFLRHFQISIALFYRKVLCNLHEMPFSEILIIL